MNLATLAGVQGLIDSAPIHRWLNIKIVGMDTAAGTVSLVAPATGNSERFDGGGQAHGGAIATLIDCAATFACAISVDHPVPTTNLRVDFLRPATGQVMTATAMVRRLGRTLAVVDIDVTAEGKLIAIGRSVHATGDH